MPAEQREQVFVSSTFLDLKEERQEVIQTLLEASCFPAGMELFPASDFDKWSLIQNEIEDSDYYVVIVGGRYGSVDEERGLSYTEMEFDFAAEIGKPILGFLHGDPGAIATNKSDLQEKARGQLNEFRAKVGDRMVKYWTSPKDLGGQVAKSLIQIRRTHPAEGWVRASMALTPEIEAELGALRLRVRELEAELREGVQSGPAPHEDLAGGRDRVVLVFTLSYLPKGSFQRKRRTYRVDLSWDEIFAAVGPAMLIESTASGLKLELGRAGIKDVRTKMPEDYEEFKAFDVDDDTSKTVLVQLTALGLIQESTKRHQISDSNQYWQMTDLGRSHLVTLRAEKATEEEVAVEPVRPATAKKAATKKATAKKGTAEKTTAKKAATKKRTAKNVK